MGVLTHHTCGCSKNSGDICGRCGYHWGIHDAKHPHEVRLIDPDTDAQACNGFTEMKATDINVGGRALRRRS